MRYASWTGLVLVVTVGIAALSGRETGAPLAVSRVAPTASDRVARMAAIAAPASSHFERNVGQYDAEVEFVRRGTDVITFLTAAGFSTTMVVGEGPDRIPRAAAHRVRLVGADPATRAIGELEQVGRVNHLKGDDPDGWTTDVPTYARVRFVNVYPGVDLVHHGDRGLHEYDFIVAPEADATRIELAFDGVDDLHVDGEGDLAFTDEGRAVRHTRPVVYQDTSSGRVPVAASFRLAGDGRVRFQLDDYDAGLPLVIDPGIAYSTYLGSSGDERLRSIAVDDTARAHVAGVALSAEFPTVNELDGTFGGSSDGVIAKLGATGSGLLYSTYIGGADKDEITGIVIALDGGALVAGETRSDDFPVVGGAQSANAGSADAFVAHLSPSGSSVTWSSLVGGSSVDSGRAVAQDTSGKIYLAGQTGSADLPTTLGAVHATAPGNGDFFVASFSATGGSFDYVTYVGGSGQEEYFTRISMYADDAGRVHVAGTTPSVDLPTTPGALNRSYRGGVADGFVGRLAANGSAWDWITYIGGSGWEFRCLIAPGPGGDVYVAMSTTSSNILTFQAFQPRNAGGTDLYLAFLSRFGGSAITSGTYLGGAGSEEIHGLAADPVSGAWLLGSSNSTNFPTVDPAFAASAGGQDLVVAKIDRFGRALEFSTYFGGSAADNSDVFGNAIAVDASGDPYFVGSTASTDLPTAGPPFQSQPAGASNEPIVVKLGTLPPTPIIDDTALYASASKFKINRKKHARGVAADALSLKGVLNPRGAMEELSGATVTVTLDGVELVSAQLDARGRAKSARGASRKFKLRLKASNGAYQVKLGGLDLREAIGVADVSGRGTVRSDVRISVQRAGLATNVVSGALEFVQKSRAGKSSRGAFSFRKHATAGGAFQSSRTTVRELGDGGHVVSISGPFVTFDSRPLTFPGSVRITIGTGVPISIPNASLRTSGTPGPRSTTSYAPPPGDEAPFARLVFSNRKRTLLLTTRALGGLGIPPAGAEAAVTHPLPVTLEIDTTDGPVRFETIIELRRASPTSTTWSR